jgi:hypothetical protein
MDDHDCARERICVSVLLLLDLSTAAARWRAACVRGGGRRLWRRASRACWIAREIPGRGVGLPACRASMLQSHGAMPKPGPSSDVLPWGELCWTACDGARSDRERAAPCRYACSRHAAEQHHELLVIQLVNVPSARLAQQCVRAAQAGSARSETRYLPEGSSFRDDQRDRQSGDAGESGESLRPAHAAAVPHR